MTYKIAFSILTIAAASVGITACGGDDEENGYSLDCSKCTGDFADVCKAAGKACKDKGVSKSECQTDINVVCGGFDFPDGGGVDTDGG